jgi:hypothetical protein
MKRVRTFRVRDEATLDRVEAGWRATLGTGQINRAVAMSRGNATLLVTTEDGQSILFRIKS